VSDTTQYTPNPNIRITIDGQVYQFDGFNGGANNDHQGNEINCEIPFKKSLTIEAYNSHTTQASFFICDYLYLLQQSSPNASKVTLLQQTNRKMVYVTGTSTTFVDLLNVTGSGYLLGIRFSGYYVSYTSVTRGDIAVDGVQKMTDRALFGVGGEGYKQSEIVGPIRFNTSLRIKARADFAGTTFTCFAWYSLD
jgi:hypothetical protein